MATAGTQAKYRTTFVDEFVNMLRAALTRQDMSIAQLAEKSKVTRQYAYRVLSGASVPSIEVAERMAAALGLEFRIFEKTA